MKRVAKADLPTKLCPVCGRPFTWRKKWERDWENVRFCSDRCRQAKAKARVNRYNDLLTQDPERAREEREIYIPPGPRLGDVVIRAENGAKGYGERLLFENLSFDVPAGAIVGIIGPNGAGKTTLFRAIIGQETLDAGTLTVGASVKLAYVDQTREDLDPDKSVWEELSGGQDSIQLGDRAMNSRAYCARFGFSGSDQQKKVGALSGGERNRVHLAKLLKSGANVILLDEPSNDLDVNTLRALEDAISTAWQPTSWPSRMTARSSGTPAITATMKRIGASAWARRPSAPTA